MKQECMLTEEQKMKVLIDNYKAAKSRLENKNLQWVNDHLNRSQEDFTRYSQDVIRMAKEETLWNCTWFKSAEEKMLKAAIESEVYKTRKEEIEQELKDIENDLKREIEAAEAEIAKQQKEEEKAAENAAKEDVKVEKINPEDVIIESAGA